MIDQFLSYEKAEMLKIQEIERQNIESTKNVFEGLRPIEVSQDFMRKSSSQAFAI